MKRSCGKMTSETFKRAAQAAGTSQSFCPCQKEPPSPPTKQMAPDTIRASAKSRHCSRNGALWGGMWLAAETIISETFVLQETGSPEATFKILL